MLKSLFCIIVLYIETFILLIHQLIDAILEWHCALFLELCPCYFYDLKIWFELMACKKIFQCSSGPDWDLWRMVRNLPTKFCRQFTVHGSNFPIHPHNVNLAPFMFIIQRGSNVWLWPYYLPLHRDGCWIASNFSQVRQYYTTAQI
jgi:hypothetical protein